MTDADFTTQSLISLKRIKAHIANQDAILANTRKTASAEEVAMAFHQDDLRYVRRMLKGRPSFAMQVLCELEGRHARNFKAWIAGNPSILDAE